MRETTTAAKAAERGEKMYRITKKNWNKDQFDRLAICLKYRSTDPQRPNIHGVKIEGGVTVCTDGQRLRADTLPILDDVPDGVYDVIKTGKEVVFVPVERTFPDWQQILPDLENAQLTFPACGAINPVFVAARCGCYVNPANVETVKHESFNLYFFGPLEPVVLKNEQTLIVLMPMRIDDLNYRLEEMLNPDKENGNG
jgi:hypothetical protein